MARSDKKDHLFLRLDTISAENAQTFSFFFCDGSGKNTVYETDALADGWKMIAVLSFIVPSCSQCKSFLSELNNVN